MTADLFAGNEALAPGATVLRGFAAAEAASLVAAVNRIAEAAPFRHMVTPGGFTMSVAMTNCGRAGWVTDRKGYRYAEADPETGLKWPTMPENFASLAGRAADAGWFRGLCARFLPDQPLRAGHAADAAPGPQRARLRPAHRLRLARPSGHLPVRRSRAGRPDAAHRARERRRGGVGRGIAPSFPRRGRTDGWRRSADRAVPLQPHLPQGAVAR